MPQKPVIFLTFANDPNGKFLEALRPEQDALQSTLIGYEQKGWGSVYPAATSEPKNLIRDLNKFTGQLIIFHFSGHNKGASLQFMDPEGKPIPFYKSGLQAFLASEKKLKLVFLNACATIDHVTALQEAEIPAVIATETVIGDTKAKHFSCAFYDSMVAGDTLQEAFLKAKTTIDSGDTEDRIYRAMDYKGKKETNNFPWGLHVQDEKILDWKLRPQMVDLLREGSQRFYEELVTNPDGRFHHLNIADILLTSAEKSSKESKLLDIDVSLNGQPLGKPEAIEALWQKEIPHAIVKGQGGMGKTVTLLQLWKQFLEGDGPIPLFVVLNEYNRAGKDERDNWITSYIVRHYLREKEPTQESINQLFQFLEAEHHENHPKLLLLLDGFNEITVDNVPLIENLQKDWREACLGEQVLMTSRYETNLNWTTDFHHFDLLPLKPRQIEAYLYELDQSFPKDISLTGVLSNPMMLTIYVASNEMIKKYLGHSTTDFKGSVSSTAEVLWNFLEVQLAKQGEIIKWEEKNLNLYRWILDHLLPWIGYKMEFLGQFDIDDWDLEDMIKSYLEHVDSGENKTDQILPKEISFRVYARLFSKCKSIWRQLAKTRDPDAEGWMQIMEKELKLITRNEQQNYIFRHQDFRDYFAARHILNEIQLGLEEESFPTCLSARILNENILSMLGELAALHKFSGRSPGEITKEKNYKHLTHFLAFLDQCRGRFQDAKPGHVVWNLVKTMVGVKGDLVGVDLSMLDLSGVGLNSIQASLGDQNARFDGSLLWARDLFALGHTGSINSISYNPKGNRLISGSDDNTIKEWDTNTGACIRTFLEHENSVKAIAYHPDGNRLISGSEDETIKEWDVQTGMCIGTFEGHNGGVNAVAYHADGNRFISGSADHTIKEWDLQTGESLKNLKGHDASIYGIVCRSDMNRLISVSHDYEVKEWDAQTGSCIRTYKKFGILILAFACHPDGSRLIAGYLNNTIKEWDLNTEECLMIFEGHKDRISAVAYHPSGNRIVSGSYDRTIKEWDTETGICICTYRENRGAVQSLAYNHDGSRLISGYTDGTVIEWDTQKRRHLRTYGGSKSSVNAVAYLPKDGHRLIAASRDNSVKEWNIKIRNCQRTFWSHTNDVSSFAFHPDGTRLISGSRDKTIKEWDIRTGKCIRTYQGHNGGVLTVDYHPTGNRLISGSEDCTIMEWDTHTGECLFTYQGHSEDVLSIAYHPGGNRLISGSWDKTLKEWDTQTKKCIGTLVHGTAYVLAVTYYPDGSKFAFGNSTGLREWDTNTSQGSTYYPLLSDLISAVAYHPKGNRIAAGSWNGTITEWDTQNRVLLRYYQGHKDRVLSVNYHPDGSRLVSGSNDETIREWDIQTGECLKVLPNVPGLIFHNCSFRNLHPASDFSELAIEIMKMYGARDFSIKGKID